MNTKLIKESNATCDHCDTDTGAQKIFSIDLKKGLTMISGAGAMLGFVLSFSQTPPIITTAVYMVSILSGGAYVVRGAVRGLFKQKFLNIDFLVIVAALGAVYIHQLPEAAAVVFFFSLAEAFEEYGISRSRSALQSLLKKSPQTATLLDGSVINISDARVGQIIAVRPGDLVPLDGKVTKGISVVNEANITGEPIPKDKHIGDTVFAGTVNENGYLEIEVTKESKDSMFSKIVMLIEQAQKAKAPSQEFIDRFAKYYTPSIVVIALLMTLIPPFFLEQSFVVWFTRAITLLVIACPCALVISTPVAITSAIGGASRRGILIKGGKYLEALNKVRAIAFDKTGTLTIGEPYISDVVTFNGFSEQAVLEDAAGIGCFSSHPLSKSIVEFAKSKGVEPHTMENYENVAGKGSKAVCMVCDDGDHCIGNLKLMEEQGVFTEEISNKLEKLEQEGKTIVLVSEGGKIMGALAISDKIRTEAKEMVTNLKALNVRSIMLTGDNQHTASYVGADLDITETYGSLLPDDKVGKIGEIKTKHGVVAMVGDGVNDAPALALADVGIAMASHGSDVAIETANIALMNDNLSNIPYVIGLSQKTIRTVKQNVTAALLAKVVFIALAVFGISNLSVAIATDTGMAMAVILNSLRLFRA